MLRGNRAIGSAIISARGRAASAGGVSSRRWLGRSGTPRTEESPDGLGPWQLLRRAPASVWAITALFAMVLACWSVLAPLYHAADEPNHADAVMRLEEGRGWPPATNSEVTDEGVGAIAASPFGRGNSRLSLSTLPVPASLAPARDARPKWQDLKAPPGTSGKLVQQIPEHPPG
ncbi:MAG: hypothetical protein JWN96_205, partial [Mycobacterium sp.]|nr:hypothetical protein [Mycobacterium sp.]